MNFNFGEVLSRAWQITWKYKVLWIFGLLASCAGGSGNSGSSYQQQNNYSGNSPITPQMARQVEGLFRPMGEWIIAHPWVIYSFIIAVGLLFILQLFLATVGQTGLVRGAYHADHDAELRFGTLWRESLHYFWRVTGLQFLIWAPIVSLFIIIMAVFVFSLGAFSSDLRSTMSGVGAAAGLFVLAFCCCLFPVIIVLSFYYRQTLSAMLVDDIGIFDSLARGWDVIVKHVGELLVMGLILFGIGLGVGIVLAIPIFIIVIPLMTSFTAGSITSWTPFLVAFALLLLYSPISWFLNGLYRTFSESVWTLTYIRLTRKPDEPNLPVDSETPPPPADSVKTIISLSNA
jgi:hypothetical protein